MKASLDDIRQNLVSLNPISVDLIDESSLHKGHAGARSGGHYRLLIVSPQFAGKRTAERHRMVYDALEMLMENGIHALSITAKTPDET